VSRNQRDRRGGSVKEGGYFYYLRTKRQQYGIRCRKKGSMDAPEEIVLDVNELAKGKSSCRWGAYDVSDDGNLLAYTTDNTGFRQFTLAVKDLRTGKLLVDHAERLTPSLANDTRPSSTPQGRRFETVESVLSSHRRHRRSGHTRLRRKDERFDIGAGKTRAKPLIAHSPAATHQRSAFTSRCKPMAEWKIMDVASRTSSTTRITMAILYSAVNDKAAISVLVKVPSRIPGARIGWKSCRTARMSCSTTRTSSQKLYISYRTGEGLPRFGSPTCKAGSRAARIPEPAYVDYPYVNREYDTREVPYGYQSFITPQSVFEYDMANTRHATETERSARRL